MKEKLEALRAAAISALESADAEQDITLGKGLAKTIEDFSAGQFKHGVLLFL